LAVTAKRKATGRRPSSGTMIGTDFSGEGSGGNIGIDLTEGVIKL
tara:strand:+ start:595 stop:729 length:135 start_codon:yes stop_codon:yes gene_type:complete